MKQIKINVLMHFFILVLFGVFISWSYDGLKEISPILSTLWMTLILLGTYSFIVMQYNKLNILLDQSNKKMKEVISSFVKIKPIDPATDSPPIRFMSITSSFKVKSKAFEQIVNQGLEYIKLSHQNNLEFSRVTQGKSSTLDTILMVSHHILDNDKNTDFYDLILTSAIDVIQNATKGSLLILNPETGLYHYQTAVGFDMAYLKNISYKLEDTFLYQNANGDLSQSMVISNVKNFDRTQLDEETLENLNKSNGLDTLEALSTPIIIDNTLYAILNIDSEIEHAFDDVDVQLIHFFSTQISIAIKNRMLVDETVKLSKFDKLTGAYNRNYFEKIFESHNELTLENLEPYSIVLCDLNFLKIINDNYGHTAGDLILTEFSRIIKSSIRDSDVFSRVGGDEFVLLLKNITLEKATEKMDDIFKKNEYYKTVFNGHKLPVSFSYGVAASPDDSMIYEVLVKIADLRMYEFKKEYKKTHQDIYESIIN